MITSWNVEDVAADIGRAAIDTDHWPVALDALSQMTNSVGGCLFTLAGDASPRIESAALAEVTSAYLRDGWIDRDERYKGVPMVRSRGVATELDFTSEEAMARNPYWQEWLGGFGLKWFAAVGVRFGDTLWALSLQRSIAAGPFLPEEVAVLVKLSGHLSSAGALSNALGHARIEGALAAFEHAKRAVILIDWTGQVSAINDSGRRLLGDDLQVSQGHVVSKSRAATARLDAAINQHVTGVSLMGAIAAVSLPRRVGRPIIAHLSSPKATFGDLLGRCVCVITLVDLDDVAVIPPTLLTQQFGLTEAEAKVAIAVALGTSIGELSKTRNVSSETLRTQLRAVFSKTGVTRQAELAGLLTSLGERTR